MSYFIGEPTRGRFVDKRFLIKLLLYEKPPGARHMLPWIPVNVTENPVPSTITISSGRTSDVLIGGGFTSRHELITWPCPHAFPWCLGRQVFCIHGPCSFLCVELLFREGLGSLFYPPPSLTVGMGSLWSGDLRLHLLPSFCSYSYF